MIRKTEFVDVHKCAFIIAAHLLNSHHSGRIVVPQWQAQCQWFASARPDSSAFKSFSLAENCIDRHIEKHGDRTALLYEQDEPGKAQKISYNELLRQVSRLANALKTQGVRKGDRVCIYMPMTPYAVYAMLACARIGAAHSVVFAGFSAEALRTRILNCLPCAKANMV